MTKAKNQVKKTGNELQESVKSLRAEIFKLKMDHMKNQLKQTSLLRTKKDELARLLTKTHAKEETK